LLLALLAGGDMGFPRARLQTTKDAVNRRLLTAGQEGRYAPEAWVRPATMDAAAATVSGIAAFGTAGSWVVTRLKGVTRTTVFGQVEFVGTNLGATTARFVVAVCVYAEDARGVEVVEVARASAFILPAVSSEIVRADLDRPITLNAGGLYAIAVFVENAGAGAGFAMAPGAAVAQPLLWGGGTTPARTADEVVRFSTSDADVRARAPVTSPDSTAVPYVAMVRGFPTDSWY